MEFVRQTGEKKYRLPAAAAVMYNICCDRRDNRKSVADALRAVAQIRPIRFS